MKTLFVIITALAIALSMGLSIAPAAYAEGEPGAPVNMSVIDVGKGQLYFSWEKGAGAVNTTVVGKIGSYPEDRADGSTIYNGNGSSVQDGPYTLDYEVFYVRAWSENASVYSLEYTELSVGGTIMESFLLLIFVGLAVVLMLVGVLKGIRWLTMASAIPWALTAVFSYGKYGDTGDFLWEVLALFGIVMFFVAGAMSIGKDRGDAGAGYEFPKSNSQKTRASWKDRLGDD